MSTTVEPPVRVRCTASGCLSAVCAPLTLPAAAVRAAARTEGWAFGPGRASCPNHA